MSSRFTFYFLLITLTAVAQAQSYEKIGVKPARSVDPRDEQIKLLPNGDLVARSVSVVTLLSYAYSVPANPSPRLISLPAWAVGDRFDIEAKATIYAFAPKGIDAQGQLQQMIRQLLADRFALRIPVDHRRMPAYALIVGNEGPKPRRSAVTANDCIFDTAPDGCHSFAIGFGHPLNARAITMDDLAHYLENWTDLR